MHKVKSETALAVFLPKIQRPSYPYPTNFSKLNFLKPTSQLSRSKNRISVRGTALWSECLTDSEKEIESKIQVTLMKTK